MAARARRLADLEAEQRAREAAADEAWAALRARAEALGQPVAPAIAGARSRSLAARSEALDRRATALDDYREGLDTWRARLDAAAAEHADLDALRARLMRTLSAEIAELGPVDLARIVGRALGEHTGPLAPIGRPVADSPRGDVAQEALLLAQWADAEDSGDTDIGADELPTPPSAPAPDTRRAVAALFDPDPTPPARAPRAREAARADDASLDALDLDAGRLPPASAEAIAAEIDAWRADGQTDGELSIDGRLDTDIAADEHDNLTAWLGHSSPPPPAAPPEPPGEPVDAIVEPLGDDSLLQWEADGLGADVDRLVESRSRSSATTVLEVLEDPFAAFAAGSSAGDSEPFGFTDLSSGPSSSQPSPPPAAAPGASLAPGSLLAPFGEGTDPPRADATEAMLYDDPFDDSAYEASLSVAALDSALDGPFTAPGDRGAYGHSLGTASGPDGELVDFDAAFRDAFAGAGSSSLDSLDSLDIADAPFPDAGGSRPRDPRLAAAFGDAAPALGSVEAELAHLGPAPIPPPLGGVAFDLEAAIAAAEPRDATADFGDALSPLDEIAPRAFESFESVDASWTGWPAPLTPPAPPAPPPPDFEGRDFEADFEPAVRPTPAPTAIAAARPAPAPAAIAPATRPAPAPAAIAARPPAIDPPPADFESQLTDFEPDPIADLDPRAPEPPAPDISEDRFEVDPLDIDIAFAELDRPAPPPLPTRPPLPATATLADALDAARADATAWAEPSTSTRFERLLDALHPPEPPDERRRVTAQFEAIARDGRPGEPDADPWAALGMSDTTDHAPLPALERRRRGAPVPAADPRPRVSAPRPVASEELAPRAPLAVRVGLETGDQFFTGFSTDISVSGIFVECARTLPVGRAVEVFFELPGGHSISAEARVQRIRDGKDGRKPGLGIAFRALVREDRVRVGRYVSQQLTGKIPRA